MSATSLRIFAAPSRYVQGPGVLDQLGELLAPFNAPPLVVVDPAIWALLGTRLETALARLAPIFGTLDGEITYAAVDALLAGIDDRAHVGVVVGVGGGKVLDAAKAVAMRAGLPVVTVPSIASNDSPASGAVAMYNDEHVLVSVDRLPRHPELVIVDTQVIAQAPVDFLRAGIGDAISKKFEAEACWAGTGSIPVGGRPLLTGGAVADACYRTIRMHGVAALRACQDSVVTVDLEAVVEAVILMSGLGFENGGLSLAHALTRGAMRARDVSCAAHGQHVAWGSLVQLAAENRPETDIAELAGFIHELGLPTSLAELGMLNATAVEIDEIARQAVAAPHVENMPFPIAEAGVAAAIWQTELRGVR